MPFSIFWWKEFGGDPCHTIFRTGKLSITIAFQVRHEVADLIVTPERESNRAFRRTYLTAACVTGNGGVRSLRDNVASASAGHQSVNRGDDCQSQGGRELR